MTITNTTTLDALQLRAKTLGLYGLLANWEQLIEPAPSWVVNLIEWEEAERHQRGLARRLRNARIGRFKPLADFDWAWPTQIDKSAISALMTLSFLQEAAGTNIVLLGPNGTGKTTIAKNIVHQAVLHGRSAMVTTAAEMLNDLAAIDSDSTLKRRLKYFAHPDVLVIDELGYLSYGNRHADLLFEIVNRRYEQRSTIITTNRPFSEWGEVFPNAACVVSLVDRLIHHAEIITIEGDSFRMKEAKARATEKTKTNRKKILKQEDAS